MDSDADDSAVSENHLERRTHIMFNSCAMRKRFELEIRNLLGISELAALQSIGCERSIGANTSNTSAYIARTGLLLCSVSVLSHRY